MVYAGCTQTDRQTNRPTYPQGPYFHLASRLSPVGVEGSVGNVPDQTWGADGPGPHRLT